MYLQQINGWGGIYWEKKDKMRGKTLTIFTQYTGRYMRRYSPRMTSRPCYSVFNH